MKYSAIIIAFITLNTFAQTKYLTKTGVVNFEASVPSFEEVKANNKSVTAIINTENGEFASLALIKGFRFKNALMEEHFNENYAESDKYPKAIFKGQINDFTLKKITNKDTSFNIDGNLTFHGKTIEIKANKVSINIKNEILTISGNFLVKASDFDIDIPKIVKSKISENIKVIFNFSMLKK